MRTQTSPPTQWTRIGSYAAVFWSLAYGLVALAWSWRGTGFPAGDADPNGDVSLLYGLDPAVGAPLFAAAALAGAGVAMSMARTRVPANVPPRWRRVAIAYGSVLSAVMLLVVPDVRVIQLFGYLPIVAVRAPFDVDIRAAFGNAISAPLIHQLVVLAGGFCWVVATVTFARRSTGRCERCGRGETAAGWTASAAAARWGRVATSVAVAIPAFYGLTRWAWALGIPLGFDPAVLEQGAGPDPRIAEIGLGTFAFVGAILTLGLVQRWGERFPRWMVGLAGRRVPIGLAVVPAWIVSVLVFTGGIGMYLLASRSGSFSFDAYSWGAVGPGLLFPLWGVALALATLAYYLRRRGACVTCGRG